VIQISLLQHSKVEPDNTLIHPSIDVVLQELHDIFADNTTLPPIRECDHTIPLKPDCKPPNIRPYRVPYKQKEEIEKLIKAMLQDELIRPHTSSYSSLAILVRKKDVSWRMYIDYRELNS
jgi:hypothetical protein